MIPLIFWPSTWPWMSRRQHALSRNVDEERLPLREFVYLDEGSLRSLLSSQTGEIKDTVQEQSQAALLDEFNIKVAGELPLTAKTEAAYRLQTTNSSSLQTSRKATVQSWFRDLHERSDLRLISPVAGAVPAARLEDLVGLETPSVVTTSGALQRGILAEFRVRLAAHDVFHLTTMMTEFTGMAEEFRDLVPDASMATFKEIQPMVKVLQRLMAGLIPITAEAVDYLVVDIGGVDHVVHRDAIKDIEVKARPLVIAGVTEVQAYWKDIRHILFSEAEFTLLCRVSRSGLQDDWNPVKLVDLFGKVAPDFARQMSAAWTIPFGPKRATPEGPTETVPVASPLEKALFHYSQGLLNASGVNRSKEDLAAIAIRVAGEIKRLASQSSSVSDQKNAFISLRLLLTEIAGTRISGARDLKLREAARAVAGLTLFPTLAAPPAPVVQAILSPPEENRAFLDVEVVAIYW
jgi:hypothetical protein